MGRCFKQANSLEKNICCQAMNSFCFLYSAQHCRLELPLRMNIMLQSLNRFDVRLFLPSPSCALRPLFSSRSSYVRLLLNASCRCYTLLLTATCWQLQPSCSSRSCHFRLSLNVGCRCFSLLHPAVYFHHLAQS